MIWGSFSRERAFRENRKQGLRAISLSGPGPWPHRMSRGLKVRCSKLLIEQRGGSFQVGNFPENLTEGQAPSEGCLVGQLLSSGEFWQKNASSLHWSLVHVYFMRLEIYPSCLPRLFLLSWKSSLVDDMGVYQLQKGTVPGGRTCCWPPYQLTAQKAKGHRPAVMPGGHVWNKWHCPSLKPFLASAHLC